MSSSKSFHGVIVKQSIEKLSPKAVFQSQSNIAVFLKNIATGKKSFRISKSEYLKNLDPENLAKAEPDIKILFEKEFVKNLLNLFFLESDAAVFLVSMESSEEVLNLQSVFRSESPNILLAEGALSTQESKNLLVLASALKAVLLIDLEAESTELAIEKSKEYPISSHLGLYFPGLKGYREGEENISQLSFFVAEILLRKEVFESASSQMLKMRGDIAIPVSEYSVRSELNGANIGSVINHNGIWRLMGFYSTVPREENMLFQMQIQRTANAIESSFVDFFYHRLDKSITRNFIDDLTIDLEEFLSGLQEKSVINDFSVKIERDKSKLLEGKLAYRIEFAPSQSLETVIIDQVISEEMLSDYFEESLA